MAQEADRIPVIVGVGQVNDRPADPADGLDPVALMVEALRRAESDAGGDVLAQCDSLAVVRQIGWPHLSNVETTVSKSLQIAPKHREQTDMPNGDSPVRLLHDAANRIGRGEAEVCAIVGAEALRTAAALARQAAKTDEKRDAIRDAPHRRKGGYAQSYGLTVPVDVYPLYENALRAHLGQTLAEGQAESGALWAGMSEVAARNAHAWLQEPVEAETIVTPTSDNRPIAHPYTKMQVANASVNQGAGFIVTSLAFAQSRGIADRAVYIGHGAAAHESTDVLARANYHSSPGLEVSIARTLELNFVELDADDAVELYSCFPCVPKLARRVLGWPLDKPITVFGGLTFGGGPIGNYMSHAIASMTEHLRAKPGKGLLFANGGYATHNHTILLSSEPTGAVFPQDYDFQAEADSERGPVPPLEEDYVGPATIETYTVHYARDGSPRLGTVVARTPEGARTLAAVPAGDAATFAFLTDGKREPVGMAGRIEAAAAPDGLRRFVPS